MSNKFYSAEFKQEVVNAYLAGEGGYRTIAKCFGIPSHSNVIKWIRLFKERGKKSLLNKKDYKSYPIHFKLDVLHYKLRTGETYQTTALKFNVNERSIIASWMKAWSTKGIEGLSNTKGRPSMSKKKRNESKKEKTNYFVRRMHT